MSKFAFQNATGLPAGGVEQFNATMLELAEGQGYEPKWQIVLASHSVCRVDGDPKLWNVHPKLWAAGQNLDVPRELCRGLESAVPIRTRMSFEYHPHSWAVVKYVLTKQLEMVAAHLDRKQDTISDSKEVLTADNSGAPASVGTEYFLAAAGGVALGPHEGQLTATDNKNPRFRITGLNLRRHTGRDTNAELYLFAPAQLAVWEKVVVPGPNGKAEVSFKLHLRQLSDQGPQQTVAQQQQQQQQQKPQQQSPQQQQHAVQQQQSHQHQQIRRCLPAKRTADAGEVANGYALAAKHAKSDIKQRAVDILNAVARGATGAMSTPAATTKAPTTPGVGQSMAVAGLPATLHHQSRPIAAAAAAQPPVSHSSMPKRGGQINIGASNVRSNSKEPANCNRAENAAAWASAMTQIRTSWPEFSDKLEAYISRNEVRAGQKAGAQDVSCQLQDGTCVHSIAKRKQVLQRPTTAPADCLSQDCSRNCNQLDSKEHDHNASLDHSMECSSDGAESYRDKFSPDPSEDPTVHVAWWKHAYRCEPV